MRGRVNGYIYLVNSVGWLAFFMIDALADAYKPYLIVPDLLIASALNVYEVCRPVEHAAGRKAAAEAVAQMQKHSSFLSMIR